MTAQKPREKKRKYTIGTFLHYTSISTISFEDRL